MPFPEDEEVPKEQVDADAEPAADGGPGDRPILHCFTVEECILAVHERQAMVSCKEHGTVMLSDIAPDAVSSY